MNESIIQVQIERYLQSRSDWTPASDIARHFGIKERSLRGFDGHPGLVSGFAISHPSKGYKHVALATTAEWLHFKRQMRRHGINELRRVRNLDKSRQRVIRATQVINYEQDTGQGVLFS